MHVADSNSVQPRLGHAVAQPCLQPTRTTERALCLARRHWTDQQESQKTLNLVIGSRDLTTKWDTQCWKLFAETVQIDWKSRYGLYRSVSPPWNSMLQNYRKAGINTSNTVLTSTNTDGNLRVVSGISIWRGGEGTTGFPKRSKILLLVVQYSPWHYTCNFGSI